VKKIPRSRPTDSPEPTPSDNLRVLHKCLRELQALYLEATAILHDLLLNRSAELVRDLCARFHALQEYFVIRYYEARAHAMSALGSVEAALFFPHPRSD
jgi:hypothetical protein